MTQLIDAVLAITLLEGVALVLYHHRTGRGVAPAEFAVNMVAGLFLMLALRCLAGDAGAAWVVLCLLAAGLAHGADILHRWRRAAARTAAVHTGAIA